MPIGVPSSQNIEYFQKHFIKLNLQKYNKIICIIKSKFLYKLIKSVYNFQFKQIFNRKKMNKLNSVKSAVSISTPKGSLIAEINNLRQQLKDIRQREKPVSDFSHKLNKKSSKQKCATPMSNTANDRFFKSSKQDYVFPNKGKGSYFPFQSDKSSYDIERKQKQIKKSTQKKVMQDQDLPCQIVLNQIWLKQKDRKLKMDIQLNKLRKIIIKRCPEQIAEQLNYILTLINISTREYSNRLQYQQNNQKDGSSEQSLLIKRRQVQIQEMSSKLLDNEVTIKQMKKELSGKKELDQSFERLKNQLVLGNNQMETRTHIMQHIIKQLQQKMISLQEQNRIFQDKIIKKEEQLIMLNQDVKYLRLQTENYKQQKNQLNQLYQQNIYELRQYKRAKTLEVQKLQEERIKWEKQCKLRRNQSEENLALQEHKITLLKQVADLRHLCTLKSTQLDDKKALMHQNQKKVIVLQSQLYRLKSQIQTIKNQKQFSEFQNQKLKQQLQDLRKCTRNSHSTGNLLQKMKFQITNEATLNQDSKKIRFQQDTQQNQYCFQNQFSNALKEQKRQHFNRSLKQKQDKLKTLEDIHSLIRKHKKQMQL